jgi:hypothetical protein
LEINLFDFSQVRAASRQLEYTFDVNQIKSSLTNEDSSSLEAPFATSSVQAVLKK